MQALFDKNTKEQLAKAQQEQGVAVKIKLGSAIFNRHSS
jgi:hypothetical protein